MVQKLPNARVQQRRRPARSAGLARTLRAVGWLGARDATRDPVCCNAMLGSLVGLIEKKREQLCLCLLEFGGLAVLEGEEGAIEANDSRLPARREDNGKWVEVVVAAPVACDADRQWQRRLPVGAVGPIHEDDSVSDSWEPVGVYVGLPIGAAGVHQDAAPSQGEEVVAKGAGQEPAVDCVTEDGDWQKKCNQ